LDEVVDEVVNEQPLVALDPGEAGSLPGSLGGVGAGSGHGEDSGGAYRVMRGPEQCE